MKRGLSLISFIVLLIMIMGIEGNGLKLGMAVMGCLVSCIGIFIGLVRLDAFDFTGNVTMVSLAYYIQHFSFNRLMHQHRTKQEANKPAIVYINQSMYMGKAS